MSEDRRTKAQLLAALEKAEENNRALRKQIPDAPVRVPEADALAACIRALDTIKDSGRSSYSYGTDDNNRGAVARTILALCEKYGVPRFDKVPEPCERRHIEDMTGQDVMQAVRREYEGFIS